MRAKRFSVEQYAKALRQVAGNRSAAAAALGCSRDSVDAAIRRHPELKALCAPRPPRTGSAQHYQPEEVAAALRQADGRQGRAAGLLGCDEGTVANYIARYAEVKAAYATPASRSRNADEVVAALRQAGGNRRRASQLLGVSYTTIYNYIRRYPAAQEECAALDQARREGRLGPGEGDGQPAQASTHPERFSPEKVAEALRRSGGVKSHAASRLHCSRQTVDGYIKRHPEVREAWIDARETMVDMAESKLHAAVERGVWRAIRYTLSTLGRDRGYSTKPLPEQKILDDSDGGAFWEAMRKAYGDKRPDLRSDPPSNDIDDSPSGEVEKE